MVNILTYSFKGHFWSWFFVARWIRNEWSSALPCSRMLYLHFPEGIKTRFLSIECHARVVDFLLKKKKRIQQQKMPKTSDEIRFIVSKNLYLELLRSRFSINRCALFTHPSVRLLNQVAQIFYMQIILTVILMWFSFGFFFGFINLFRISQLFFQGFLWNLSNSSGFFSFF